MDNLPGELLEKIFYQLHQKDKVECLTVCRAWKKALENTVLFQTIRVHSKLQLDKLVSKIHRDPSKSNHVGRLILEIKDIESAEIDILCFLFFNIRELEFHGSANSDYDLRFTKTLSFHSWSKSIKRIMEPSSNVFTTHILKGSVCPVLTEISLCGKERQPVEKLITLLANAPALKYLSLQNYSLSLVDLELIHDNSTLLSSLSLHEIEMYSDILPTVVKPAKYMTKLFLNTVYTSSSDNFIDFQQYMIKKYPEITNMLYSVIVDAPDLTNAINEGFIPQIQHVAPYLTNLTLVHSKHTQYVFPALDLYGGQLKELTVRQSMDESQIGEIVNSKQTQFIEKLSLYSTLDNTSQILLSKLSVLKVLSIKHVPGLGNRGDVNINRILNLLGNNILELELVHINLLLDLSTVIKCPNLKTLKLKGCSLPPYTDSFISQTLPELRTLIMDTCIWKSSSFYLGDLNLSYLEFRGPIPSNQDKVLTVEIFNNKKRWYSADKVSESNPNPTTGPVGSPAMKSLPFDKYEGIPYITFLCHSLYDFFMVNTSS